MAPTTHNGVATVGVRAPLAIIQMPTIPPGEGEVLVRVEWTASTPLDLHQNDGGLLVKHPQILGDGLAGTVKSVGPGVQNLAVGDKVFGFCFEESQRKAQQEFVTVPETSLGKVPAGFTLQEAVTLPNNLVTVFHATTFDLGLPLPWPRPATPSPVHANSPILIWGGSSSCGQYAIQILTQWGYKNIIATSSPAHHEYLRSLGAGAVHDYRDPNVANLILESARGANTDGPAVPFILDCIASQYGSLAKIANIAQKDTIVAALLPVIVKDASDTEAPEYAMDVQSSADWAEGVQAKCVRTHFYQENVFFKTYLQSTMIPTLLAEGVVKPNKQRIVEGKTLLERAQKALDTLRNKAVSDENPLAEQSKPRIDDLQNSSTTCIPKTIRIPPCRNIKPKTILGAGASSVVYLAGENKVEKRFKSSEDLLNERTIYQILRSHPRLLSIYHIEDDCIIMDWMKNGDLARFIESHPEVTQRRKHLWVTQIAESFNLLHTHEISHCDSKLENFLVDDHYDIKICDFASSHNYKAPSNDLAIQPSRYRRAIDDFNELVFNPADDIFAFGSICYEIITGEAPYPQLDDEGVKLQFIRGEFPATEGLSFGSIIRGCWNGKFMSFKAILSAIKSEGTALSYTDSNLIHSDDSPM
ncbi:hypothetical protein V492_01336 [Pseudogymnoascus sp. VKM F-4246]|nr:hypothetical protein V492_01336 [Pseudogymnoascus sp. VKM F-4246]